MDFKRLESQYLSLTLEYKAKYDNEKWYNFKKKREYRRMYKSGLEMVERVSNMHLKFGSS
jgi:hypothetical protein